MLLLACCLLPATFASSQVKLPSIKGKSNSNKPRRGGKLVPAGFSVLYTFTWSFQTTNDGAFPYGSLLQDSAGNLYGTTNGGGSIANGTVWKLTPSGTETVLYNFEGRVNGVEPVAGLVNDSAGNLYGTTEWGIHGHGTVFKLDPSYTYSTVYAFQGGTDGSNPISGAVRDSQGNFYGTTLDNNTQADPEGFGTVYKVDSSGNETVLHNFTGGSDGGAPYNFGSLLRDSAGNLYGTTSAGGDVTRCSGTGCGTVFKVDTSGNLTTLYTFLGGNADGCTPAGGVIADKVGNLYGTTTSCGNGGQPNTNTVGYGTVWKLTPTGTETVLYNFTGGTDGANPYAGVTLDSSGNLYGVTVYGGAIQVGVLYEVSSGGTFSLLHTFDFSNDGGNPIGPVLIGSDGNLYGVGTNGGSASSGTIWGFGLNTGAQTTTALSSSLNPSHYGQPVTFTAKAMAKSGGGTPTGNVTFYDGTTTLGTQPLSGGTAQFSTSTLTGGSHSITAAYGGDSTFQGSTSSPLSQTIQLASQTITFTVSAPTTAPYNSSFTVAASASSGLQVTFSSSGVCTNSGATFTMTSGTGTCSVIAIQAGNDNYAAAPKLTQTTHAAKIAQTISFTGAPATAAYQSTFAVEATSNSGITPTVAATGVCTISGTTVTMTSGTGSCATTAKWATNSDYLAVSATQTTAAEKLASTINWATPAAITYGTPLSATQLDAIANVAGKFTYTPAAGKVLNAGQQTLSATFAPTLSKDYADATASAVLTVNQVGTTTTITKTSPNPSKVGQTVTAAFTVTQAVTNPTKAKGSVTVTASTGESCTGTLAGTGKGSCSLTFATAGSRTLTAGYAGDANNKGSVSAAITQNVN
jgi:uncharacterized repeat protein (TIGR03803 family)